ncbi:MAG: ABC transporter permease [Anaerolineaceae bacterium]
MTSLFDIDLLAATFRIMTPILLAGLGGVFCWKASIFNIGLEGFMLIGSFFAIYLADMTGNIWLGLLGGVISGIFLSLIFAIATLIYKANELIVGIAINLMAYGLTSFLLRNVFGASGVYRPINLEPLPKIYLPFLENVPFLGPALNGQTPLVYVSLLFILITYLLLYKTPFGLSVRCIGENEEAARTAGINSIKIKLLSIIWSGALCGLAGAHLSTGYVFEFSENMVQGRGFTAVSAIVFGGADPSLTFIASLVFAFADAFGFRLQLESFGIPPELMKMFPYLLAIIVITISSAIRQKRNNL